jgi:hypothetical protein
MACVGPSSSVCGLVVEAASVDEEDFWSRLEFRITRELSGFEDRQLRACWCDGLVADEYELHGAQPRIRGRARCGPSGQERWTFTRARPSGHAADGVGAVGAVVARAACVGSPGMGVVVPVAV